MKNKLLAIIFCMLMTTSILTLPIKAEANSIIKEKNISIIFSEPNIIEKGEYINLNIDEANSLLIEQGKPLLPAYVKTFVFPFKTQIKNIECIALKVNDKVISKEIEPSPKPSVLDNIDNNDNTIKDTITYNSNDFFPNCWYDYKIGCGLEGDSHVVFLSIRIYPVRYSPGLNLIQCANNINIKINYIEPIKPVIFKEKYDMIIITPNDFSLGFRALVDYKNDSVCKTKLVTLDNIYDGTYFPVEGRDDQEKIKYFIKNAIENWGISYVLLAGGANKIPIRLSYDQDGIEENFISDLYYADIYDYNGDFCSWDSNNNNIFGEYNYQGRTDIVDLYPDVYLGRLNLRDSSELDSVINKIITYESTGAYMEDWFKTIVTCGGDTFNDGAGYCEGEEINQAVIDLLGDFNSEKIWATNGELLNTVNIDNAVENGAGFLYFSGHGTHKNWATHPKNDFNNWIPLLGGYTYLNAEQLQNKEKLPIVYIGGCSNCNFSENISFGWSFMKNPNGGGISVFGLTGLGYGYPGPSYLTNLVGAMELSFFKAYKLNNAETTGELWSKTLNNYLNNYWSNDPINCKIVEELEPFCDPSLIIVKISDKPNKPQAINGQNLGMINIEYNYKTSTTDPNGDMIKYCFDWGDGSVSWTDWMNSGAEASLNHIWTKPGYYNVKVKARDKYGLDSPWSDTLIVHIQGAIIDINSIKGGFFKISAIIKSIGDIEATNVTWSILIEGGYYSKINSLTKGEISSPIPIGETVQINSKIIFGIGKIDITVTATSPTSNTAVRSDKGFIFGTLILILK